MVEGRGGWWWWGRGRWWSRRWLIRREKRLAGEGLGKGTVGRVGMIGEEVGRRGEGVGGRERDGPRI